MMKQIILAIGCAFLTQGPILAAPATPVMTAVATGSNLAVWKLPADARPRATPVLFLHGGPGLYTEARRFDEAAVMRAAGFDTIFFDLAGGGRSARLAAGDYGLDRAIADVEALRIALGKDQLVLWGQFLWRGAGGALRRALSGAGCRGDPDVAGDVSKLCRQA